MSSDGIKWFPTIEVVKYEPSTVQEIIRFCDSRNLRTVDRVGLEANGPELRMLERNYGLTPDEITRDEGNELSNAGRDRISNLITGGGGAAFTQTQGWSGVGDSSTAFSGAHTTLQAATNKFYQIIDGSSLVINSGANGRFACATTFGTGDGNFAWQEWCLGIATGTLTAGTTPPGTSPVMVNRKVASLGTKASGASWTLNATITIS